MRKKHPNLTKVVKIHIFFCEIIDYSFFIYLILINQEGKIKNS